jgi:hypothetical protein
MIFFRLIVCLLITEINSNAINQTVLTHPDAKLATSTSKLEVKDDKVVSALRQFAAPKELPAPKKDAIATLETLFSEGGTETVHKSKSVVPRKGVEFPKDEEVSSPPGNDVLPIAAANVTTELKHENQILKTVTSTNVPNVTLTTTPLTNKTEALNVTNVSTTSTTTTATPTTTTSTTTTTTTTTTTARPKKPQIVLSPADDPSLLINPDFKAPPILTMPNQLSVEEPAPPVAQATKQYISQPTDESPGGHREYIVPVILLIFAIPMLLGSIVVSYRRFKDWWLRHYYYRRMDFLVDGMYND